MSTNDQNADQALTATHWGRAGGQVLTAAKRVLWALLVLFGVSVLVFVVMRVLPGDVVETWYGDVRDMTDAQRDVIRERLGTTKPLLEQYVNWLSGALRLDMGRSLWTNRPVFQEIGDRLPVTIELLVLAVLCQGLVWVPTSVVLTRRTHPRWTGVVRAALRVLTSVPTFWAGTIAIVILSTAFGWIPPLGGIASLLANPVTNLGQFVLPALFLGLTGSARLVRLGSEDVTLSSGRAITQAWRRALGSVGYSLSLLLGAGVAIENIFSLPGMGQLFLSAFQHRDIPQFEAVMLTHGLLLWVVWCSRRLFRRTLGEAAVRPIVGAGTVSDSAPTPSGSWQSVPSQILRRPSVFLPTLLLLSLVIVAVAAPALAPYDPIEVNTAQSLLPPGPGHLLGTDELGRDLLSRAMYALRMAFSVGLGAAVLGAVVGAALRAVVLKQGHTSLPAGAVPTVLSMMPGLVLAIALISNFGSRYGWLAFAMMLFYPTFQKLSPGRMPGLPRDTRLFMLSSSAFVLLAVGDVLALQATLEFLGVGPPPPWPTLGAMLSGSARSYMSTAPWLALVPGVVLTVLILCFNLLGEALAPAGSGRPGRGSTRVAAPDPC